MAALISDEKGLVLLGKKCFWVAQNATGYRSRPVLPSGTQGAPLTRDLAAIWTVGACFKDGGLYLVVRTYRMNGTTL